MDLIALASAAERLGVSERQARNLADAGDIRLLARGVVDANSVSTYLRDRGVIARRVWSEKTAWAAVSLLAGADVTWLHSSQVSRLKRRLTDGDPAELTSRVRNRATILRFSGHHSVVARVADQLVRGPASIGDLSVEPGVDGYLDERRLVALVDRFHLRADDNGAITVRRTLHLEKVQVIAVRDPQLLLAINLATSADAREREIALAVIRDRVAGL